MRIIDMLKKIIFLASIFLLVGCGKSIETCSYQKACASEELKIIASNALVTYDGVSIDFEITNNTDNDIQISYDDFSLFDDDNTEYSGTHLPKEDSLGTTNISSKANKSVKVYFKAKSYETIVEIRVKSKTDEILKIAFDGKEILKTSTEEKNNEMAKIDDRIEKEELLKDLNNSFNVDGIKYTLDNLPKYESEVIQTVRQLNQNQVSKYILDGAQKANDDGISITSDLIRVLRDEESELIEKSKAQNIINEEKRTFTKEQIVSTINYTSSYFEYDRYYTVEDIPEYDIEIHNIMKKFPFQYTKYIIDKLQEAHKNGEDITKISIDALKEEENTLDNSKEVKSKMVKEGINIETGTKNATSKGNNDSPCLRYDPKTDLTYYSDKSPKKGNHCLVE